MKRSSLLYFLFVCTCCLTPVYTFAGAHNETAIVHNLDSLFDFLEQHKMFNGNVAVSIGQEAPYIRCVGYADLKRKEALVPGSAFELASVSKQFTAMGILKLVEKGKLSLEDDVRSLLPDLPYQGITIRMLLNHTSGLPDYMELFAAHWDTTKIATNDDIVPMLKQYKPTPSFQPGESWEYSNTGYALLACIIKKVSGEPYADYMKKEVFEPLHMKHTFIYSRRLAPRAIDHYAFGYVKDDAGQYMLPDEIPSYNPVYFLDGIQGDGTVNTTAADMLLWDQVVMKQQFLDSGLWKQALTPVTPKNGEESSYGFGWMIGKSAKNGKVLYHSGGWPGYTTYNLIYPDKKIAVVFLSNMEANMGTFEETITALKHIALGDSFALPQVIGEKKIADIDKSIYKEYIGTYNIYEGFDIEITAKDGHLYLQGTGQPKNEVQPESATRFFIPDYPVNIEFNKDAAGTVISFTLFQHGKAIPAKKIK